MAKRKTKPFFKRNFSENFYPERPIKFFAKAKKLAKAQVRPGLPLASNGVYIKWLVKESMLENANKQALEYSGKSKLWKKPFAKPRPRSAVKKASVWYTAYPISMITSENESTLASLGSDELWSVFEKIGIKGLHTGPMKKAGGLDGWTYTESIDGHFDRISNKLDTIFGTEDEFKALCEVANKHGGIIIDDIVPGHTGKGADFRLAEMNYGEYKGIYHMVEIDKADWNDLPDVPKGQDSVNINPETEALLKNDGYIIGKLQRIIFYEPGVKESNWSVTKPVRGVDGVKRRWVYLHYFKEGQPSINWLDPTFAGMKLVVGDALHSVGELGSTGLRLDANGFLGIEKSDDDSPAWSEGHPLSQAANQLVSGMVRKVGGFTFQELNLSIDDIKLMSEDGADLSYDFINRPAYHHALATGDTEFLRLTLNLSLEHNIDPVSLVHAMQNHDELTYELVHFWTVHKNDIYNYHGQDIKGFDLRKIIRRDLKSKIANDKAPYNLLFTENGIACTTVSIITAVLGYSNPYNLSDDEIEKVKKVHLLLVMFNALQPGVFALSGWDLSGSLTLENSQVKDLTELGDTRWVNRGAYDLMNSSPGSVVAESGIPKTVNLYGNLPDQLSDENSFAMRLKNILEVRDNYSIDLSKQLDIPNVSNKSLLVMVHRLSSGDYQATVLNFADKELSCEVSSSHLPIGCKVTDMFSQDLLGFVDENHTFNLSLLPYQGTSLLIESTSLGKK
ncbi:maltose alpha-D-glucosyltransferase [Candidatus Saccharibacteria bacterium]|nr:maltose alpha-D-glucosyltransferase [Candidatus Saccharibacteria bacterium]MBP7834779.1 maltose alpha-D-glucosyltransferase [Candidatus Saccharibacteria bacterium]